MGELFLLCLFSTVKIDTEKLVVCEDDSLDEDELNVRCSPNTSFSPVIFFASLLTLLVGERAGVYHYTCRAWGGR